MIRHDQVRRRLVESAVPLGAFALALTAGTLMALQAHASDHERVRTETRVTAELLGTRVADWTQSRLRALEALLRMADPEDTDSALFERQAEVLVRTHAGLQALQVMDARGVICRTAPLPENAAALGVDLRNHSDPAVPAALARAIASGRPAATPVIDLVQGHRGFAVYAPGRQGDDVSFGAVFRLDTVVAECFPAALLGDRFHVDVVDGMGRMIHSAGARDFDANAPHDVHVPIVDRAWTLHVYPSEAFVAAGANPNIVPLLAAWGVLSFVGMLFLGALLRRERRRGEAEAHLSRVLDLAMDAIITLDTACRVTHFNMGAALLFNLTPEAACGRSIGELVPSLQGASLQALRPCELEARRSDGVLVPVEVTATDVVRDDGAEFVLIVRDISARRDAERTQARLLRAIENTAEAIVLSDSEQRIEYVNPAFVRLSGYSPAEVLGRTPRMLKSGHHPESFYREMYASLAARDVWAGRFVNRCRDGSTYVVDCTISVLRDARGEIDAHIAVQRDVTYLRKVEDRLRDSHRMEAIGRLAGGVAHDFNNVLTVVEGHAALLGEALADDPALRRRVECIREAVGEAARLTHNLLAVSKRQVLAPKAVELNDLVESAGALLRPLIGEDVRLQLDLASGLPPILADASQIEQVLLNLVVNARDAMPHGGDLRIATHLDRGADARVVLVVRDTGIGMDAATMERIFDPFFTTKRSDERSGLGLSTVYGIVEQTGGTIDVDSTPGRGTEVRIALPTTVVQTPQGDGVAPDHDADTCPSVVRVLIVEDEAVVRELAVEILASQDFEVRAATDGVDALRVLDETGFVPDIVVTDVVMPHMNGRELAAQVRRRLPDVCVLYVSGYSADAFADGTLDPRSAFVPKPYGPNDLERGIRDLLGDRAPACA